MHKLFICKNLHTKTLKLHAWWKHKMKQTSNKRNKMDLKLHACYTHISKKPCNKLELGTLVTKQNQHRARGINQKHLQNVIESWKFKSDEQIQNVVDNQST
jgi:hypothetical protein